MFELAWAGGLFEGEGSWSLKSHDGKHFYPGAAITNTDRDVLERFRDAVAMGSISGPYDQGHKPFWNWHLQGFEKTQMLGAMLWRGLGVRRRKRLAEVLRGATPPDLHVPRPRRARKPECCDRPHVAKGLCWMHYMREYRKKKRAA